MKNDSEAADYIEGIGVHWYLDRVFSPEILDKAHEDFPDKFILGTEACVGESCYKYTQRSILYCTGRQLLSRLS